MTARATPLLFVHGYWHGSWCWSDVIAHVAAGGHPALAVDLAGHGLRARRPACLTTRPFDPAALATEVSPVADVDLDQAADLPAMLWATTVTGAPCSRPAGLTDQAARAGGTGHGGGPQHGRHGPDAGRTAAP
ncbi:alpha/beta fold hydrolase [Streptomyces sp. MBT65]|uniref:alpha/beta fold hydrolase n=1 Tax=Streptomyces sp. MBT65 TaxID=1488395 RepID=UPI001F2E4AE7|nr:alpha/beta fold hydrolase [Streptomyces sp. MBT65]